MVQAEIHLVSFVEFHLAIGAVEPPLYYCVGKVHGQLSILAQFVAQRRQLWRGDGGVRSGDGLKRTAQLDSEEVLVGRALNGVGV